jgi:two-component sensor histidine kinase
MPTTDSKDNPSLPGRGAWSALNLTSLAVALIFGALAALFFRGFFYTPFWVLLTRSWFLSLLLLLVFVGMQRVPAQRLPAWLPHWLASVFAVALVAPLGTVLAYGVTLRGNLRAFVQNDGVQSGVVVYTLTALLLGLLLTLAAQLRQREAQSRALALALELERSRQEKQALNARLALLQSQVEPHFLFNTLANVQALVEDNSPCAADVLKSLIAYLRATVPRLNAEQASLADELALVRSYLALMQMRMPDRLQFDFDVDGALLMQRFPTMALLTLVENAVRHGIDPSEQGGHIQVGARNDGAQAVVWVGDSGVGMSELAQPGVGLSNLRERLSAYFGGSAELRLQVQQPHGLRAEIHWVPTAALQPPIAHGVD